ncbi:unknown [Prevotella sp. CAG:1185]|nr:unknown [Prevotella sp. CAG:1185]
MADRKNPARHFVLYLLAQLYIFYVVMINLSLEVLLEA